MDIQQLAEAERRVAAARAEQLDALATYRQHLAAHIAEVEATITAMRAVPKSKAPDFILTDREKQVIQCLMDGITTGKAIGKALRISERTVRTHIANIMAATGIRSRAELAVRFKEWWS